LHIPDGYLDMHIAIIFYLLSAVVLGYSILRAKKEIDEKKIPLVGVVAAGIFAAQMLNWPIPGGTSAHLVGGAIAAILLGPYLGCIAMASVLIIQCLFFGDGGITALGANIWNMGVVDVFTAYFLYTMIQEKTGKKSIEAASFVAGWLGITFAAIFAGIEVGLSSSFKYSIGVTVPAMGIWHGILGIVEGIITAGVIMYIYRNRRDLLYEGGEKNESGRNSE